ncbi:MAG: ankyrin repeat domain-containing protein [Methylophilaceae bacterium]
MMAEQTSFHGITADSLQAAFRISVIHNRIKEMKLLLNDGADIDEVLDSFERKTPLHFASFNLKQKLVEFLIANGANLNALDKNEYTPLMNACSRGGMKGGNIALKLIEAGADVTHVRVSDSQTALTCAVANFIAKSCSAEVIQSLINKGAEIDGPPGTDQTPLMLAARTNNIEAISLLLKNGANPQIPCGLPWAKGLTAEFLADKEGRKEAFEFLASFRNNGYKFE